MLAHGLRAFYYGKRSPRLGFSFQSPTCQDHLTFICSSKTAHGNSWLLCQRMRVTKRQVNSTLSHVPPVVFTRSVSSVQRKPFTANAPVDMYDRRGQAPVPVHERLQRALAVAFQSSDPATESSHFQNLIRRTNLSANCKNRSICLLQNGICLHELAAPRKKRARDT